MSQDSMAFSPPDFSSSRGLLGSQSRSQDSMAFSPPDFSSSRGLLGSQPLSKPVLPVPCATHRQQTVTAGMGLGLPQRTPRLLPWQTRHESCCKCRAWVAAALRAVGEFGQSAAIAPAHGFNSNGGVTENSCTAVDTPLYCTLVPHCAPPTQSAVPHLTQGYITPALHPHPIHYLVALHTRPTNTCTAVSHFLINLV